MNFSWLEYIACNYRNMCMMNLVEYERTLPQKYCYSWNGIEHCDVAAKFWTCVLKLPGSNIGSDIGFLTEMFRSIP